MGPRRAEAQPPADAQARGASSPWSAFRHTAYAVVWTATVVANIGAWMYNAGSGWLMTNLNPDPWMVSLVQVASSLPLFLFALPAGALADIVDKRRFLLVTEIANTVIATIFAVLVWRHSVNTGVLLLFTFLIGVGSAVTAPAWQAIVSQLVPREDLPPAVAANSVGVNVSRAIGPALGGMLVGALGIASPFWVNAFSNLGSVGALVWWRPPRKEKRYTQLPGERLVNAIMTGLRHARNNRPLRATLLRAVGFFLFASAYWALLPLVARQQVSGGPELYGVLLGAIGAGAVGGAFALPRIKAKLGPDRLVAAGQAGTAAALFLFGLARTPALAVAASVIAGVSWIAVLASLNVSAQLALPDWVRARGLAIYVTVFYGAMTIGSALWGQAAHWAGLTTTHYIAAAGILVTIPLTWQWKLHMAAGLDLTPSVHWPEPVIALDVEGSEGPVMVMLEYHVDPGDRDAFLTAMETLSRARSRTGAYAWGTFEDMAVRGRFVETFLVESWVEHLRQHERVTKADQLIEDRVRHFATEPPTITHLITAEPDDEADR